MLLEKAKMTRYYAPRMTGLETPSELRRTVGVAARQAGLLLLPLGSGDLGLDPAQRKQPPHSICPVNQLF